MWFQEDAEVRDGKKESDLQRSNASLCKSNMMLEAQASHLKRQNDVLQRQLEVLKQREALLTDDLESIKKKYVHARDKNTFMAFDLDKLRDAKQEIQLEYSTKENELRERMEKVKIGNKLWEGRLRAEFLEALKKNFELENKLREMEVEFIKLENESRRKVREEHHKVRVILQKVKQICGERIAQTVKSEFELAEIQSLALSTTGDVTEVLARYGIIAIGE